MHVSMANGKIVAIGGGIFSPDGGGGSSAAIPTFSPVTGSYASAQTVTISCSTGSSSIYYTTDGSTPTFPITGTTQLYTVPIVVSVSGTVDAIGVASGISNSTVGSASYTITSSATQIFNYPSGFTGQASAFSFQTGGIQGSSQILLGAGSGHSSGAAWYRTKQPNNSFTTQFTFQQTGATVGTPIGANGFAFCVQDSTSPPGAAGFVGIGMVGDANCSGYGDYNQSGQFNNANPSIGIIFDMSTHDVNYQTGGNPSGTGLYVCGGTYGGFQPICDLTPYGVNLFQTHIFECTIVYDGTLLTMVLLDTTANTQARFVWPVNIPACMASNSTSWVGFTQGEAGNSPGIAVYINSWAFWTGYNTRLATPTFSLTPGQYLGTQSVTVSGPSGATLFYTTNGLLPTSSSAQVTGAISISVNTNLQVVAIQSGFTDSLVAQAMYKISTSNTIHFSSGFSVGDGMIQTGYAYRSGSSIILTDTTNEIPAAGNTWYNAPVNISGTWSTTFTLKITSGQGGGQGMTFIIQGVPIAPASNAPNWASNNGPFQLGGAENMLGYGGTNDSGNVDGNSPGILNSCAIKFDMASGNTTGFYTIGSDATILPSNNFPGTGGTSVSPVILNNNNPITCALSYNGTTLSMVLTDTVNGHTFSTSFTENIPALVGSNFAYVGFGGANGGNTAIQAITNWTGF